MGNLVIHRLKRHSPSRLSVMSSDSSSFNYYSDDLLERLFPSNVSTSGASDDTGSIYSSASTGTEQADRGRPTRPVSVPTVRKHLGQKEPDVASISESSTQYSGDASLPSNQHDAVPEDRGSLREPRNHSNLFSSQKAKTKIPSSQADILSQIPTSVVVEDAEATIFLRDCFLLMSPLLGPQTIRVPSIPLPLLARSRLTEGDPPDLCLFPPSGNTLDRKNQT